MRCLATSSAVSAALRRCPDITKARRQVGFEPAVDLDDGLKRFLGWTDKTYTGDA